MFLLAIWICAVLSADAETQLEWIIGNPFDGNRLSKQTHFSKGSSASGDVILEFGPR